jgi:hypothetical protein
MTKKKNRAGIEILAWILVVGGIGTAAAGIGLMAFSPPDFSFGPHSWIPLIIAVAVGIPAALYGSSKIKVEEVK